MVWMVPAVKNEHSLFPVSVSIVAIKASAPLGALVSFYSRGRRRFRVGVNLCWTPIHTVPLAWDYRSITEN